MTKPKKCSACGERVRGHDGPTGAKCKYHDSPPPIPGSPIPGSPTPGSPDTGPPDHTLLLVNELSKLNINMAKMAAKQDTILQLITNKSSSVPITPSSTIAQGMQISSHIQDNSWMEIAPHVSPKTIAAAQNGELINLVEFLPTTECYNDESEVYVTDGIMQSRPKRTKRTIDSCYTWLMAWSVYEQVIVEKHHSVYSKFAKYRSLIQQCDRRYVWQSVYSYDVQFRAKCGAKKSFDFDNMDVTLYTTLLDATAIRGGGKQCARCRSYDHFVKNCPFPEEYSLAQTAKTKPQQRGTPSKDKWFHQNIEGCNNFQNGRCFYAGCTRAHVCRRCRGPEPFYKCPCERRFNQISAQPGSMG